MSLVPYKLTALARIDVIGLNIIPNASVSVVIRGSGVFATLKTDSTGATPLSNPFLCDVNGEKEFWTNGGNYTITVAGGQSWDISLNGDSDITKISTWADIGTTPVGGAGQVFTLAQHTSGGFGAGPLMSFPGSVVDDGGYQKNSGTPGFFLRRLPQGNLTAFDFGALGDGVNHDAPAINAAIAHLSSNGGGTLDVLDGQYLLNIPIELADYVEIKCSRNAVFLQGVNGMEIFRSLSHAYFCAIRNPRIDGNGKNGGIAFALNNFRLQSGIYDANLTDIENGLYLLDGCFGVAIDNFTAYDGCLNPIVIVGNAATAVINNPNLDNASGRWAGLGYGIQIQNGGTPNEGVIINGGYAQGYIRGLWDQGRGTRVFGTYFEQCTEADVYAGGAIQGKYSETQHFAGIGASAFKLRSTDGCSVISPNMGSGGRAVLYDVNSTNTNFSEYRQKSATGDNTPVGSLTYVSSLAAQTSYSFTPTIKGATTPGTAVYTVQSGVAVLTGAQVHVAIELAWSGHTGTGALLIDGIPSSLAPVSFTPKRMGQVIVAGFATTFAQVYANFSGAASQLRIIQTSAAGTESLLGVPASGELTVSLVWDL